MSEPGCVDAWGHGYLGAQYLGVLVPRGVDTWAVGPWRSRYLGVQVPGILVPRDVGVMRCWYLGYQYRGVSTWSQGYQGFWYSGVLVCEGICSPGCGHPGVLEPGGVGTWSTGY